MKSKALLVIDAYRAGYNAGAVATYTGKEDVDGLFDAMDYYIRAMEENEKSKAKNIYSLIKSIRKRGNK